MRNLLKTDLYRIVKDKLFLVLAILAGVFALITPLANFALLYTFEEENIRYAMDAKSLFLNAFGAGSNFGLICPILLTIALCKDFSHGTVRNKIICGKSRISIFLSMFITASVILCGIMLAHALVTLGVSLCFFNYQATPFTGADFGELMLTLLFNLCTYLFVAGILSFFSVAMKNAGLAVVMYLAVNFFFVIYGGILDIAFLFSGSENTTAYAVFEFLSMSNPFSSSLFAGETGYTWKDFVYRLLPTLLGTGGAFGLGFLIFRKKDLK
ncbi:MAG: hypothetical protein E7368_04045 [Clostridiales bacterium]|nr:hypothetical protein [Clostridiales bacterium]